MGITIIKDLRRQRGLSIIQLAYRTQVHPTTISMAERRKLAPGSRARAALSAFFEVPEERAFDGDGLAL